MKKIILLFPLLFLTCLVIMCKNTKNGNTETSTEIKVEKTDSITRAEVKTIKKVNGEVSEEILLLEGTHEEVMKKVELFTTEDKTVNVIINKVPEIIKRIQFNLKPKSGSETSGLIIFTEENGSVNLKANIKGLIPGVHAIHIHEKADCSSDDGKSSGGHWNPTFENHGSWGSENGYHRGDIGNFNTNNNGEASVSFTTDLWCLNCKDPIKNIVGKAIIIHQGEDDLISQPSGAAGKRISCAGIIK